MKEPSEWHQELEVILMTFDDCLLECDGMTYVASHLLNQAGVSHQCLAGSVIDHHSGHVVTPHLWIELQDGWTVDLRLRMWLGDDDAIPHGVFHRENEPQLEYKGKPLAKDLGLSPKMLNVFTDGMLSVVRVDPPCLQGEQAVGY